MAALSLGCAVLVGSTARADQTVYFDDAGGAPHISLVGDSTLTGVRWYDDYGALERFNFVFSAESCRRTIERSCISREGYRSENVIDAMRTLDGELGDLLVGKKPGRTSDDEVFIFDATGTALQDAAAAATAFCKATAGSQGKVFDFFSRV